MDLSDSGKCTIDKAELGRLQTAVHRLKRAARYALHHGSHDAGCPAGVAAGECGCWKAMLGAAVEETMPPNVGEQSEASGLAAELDAIEAEPLTTEQVDHIVRSVANAIVCTSCGEPYPFDPQRPDGWTIQQADGCQWHICPPCSRRRNGILGGFGLGPNPVPRTTP